MAKSNNEAANIKENRPDIVKEEVFYKPTRIGKEAFGAKVEGVLLRFVIDHIEKNEREGQLPERFSQLDPDVLETLTTAQPPKELTDLMSILRDKEAENLPPVIDKIDYTDIVRLSDAIEKIRAHTTLNPESNVREFAVVKNANESSEPLGKIGNARLVFCADLHHAPSNTETGIRDQAFKKYAPLRNISNRADAKTTKDSLQSEEPLLDDEPEHMVAVNKKFMIREAQLNRFQEKLTENLADPNLTEAGLTPVFVNIGDILHDGGNLLDIVSENIRFLKMMDAVKEQNADTNIRAVDISGNHDMDSRVKNSPEMLTTLFGHRIFTQELGNGAMMVALDTNIENPEWERQYLELAGEAGKKLIEEKKELQKQVLERMAQFEGPVIVVGHNPSRLIELLATKNDDEGKNILQKSNIQRIVAGHTHNEKHVELPVLNAKGEVIKMDVISSFPTIKKGKPQAIRAFELDIVDGKISDMTVTYEPQDQFEKAVEEQLYEAGYISTSKKDADFKFYPNS